MLTPQIITPNLAKALAFKGDLWLKREDLHPLGSHKGRSIPLMIQKHHEEGWNNFVISSSGNAALAATIFVNGWNEKNPQNTLSLKIFVGKNIDEEKLEILKSVIARNEERTTKQSHGDRRGPSDLAMTIYPVSNPKQQAFKIEKEGKAKFLRQSTDDAALFGYFELAKELAEIENLSAVFIPTSSGTTAQGLYDGFQTLGINPQIHIVQTTVCHPIVDSVTGHNTVVIPTHASIASAIVDKIAHRKQAVVNAIKNSHGNGWIVADDEIKKAMDLVKQTEGIEISPNSAVSLAALHQALQTGWHFPGPIACLFTGR